MVEYADVVGKDVWKDNARFQGGRDADGATRILVGQSRRGAGARRHKLEHKQPTPLSTQAGGLHRTRDGSVAV